LFSRRKDNSGVEEGYSAEEGGSVREYGSGQAENVVSYRDIELEKIVNRYKSIEGEWSVA
jgi:hypothetical protein